MNDSCTLTKLDALETLLSSASRVRIFTVAPRLDHHHSQEAMSWAWPCSSRRGTPRKPLTSVLSYNPTSSRSVARRPREGRATICLPRRQQARLVSPLRQCRRSAPLPIRRPGACAPGRSSSADTSACSARWAIKASRTSQSLCAPCAVSCPLPSFSSVFVSCVFSQGKAFRLHRPGTNPPQPPSRAAPHPRDRIELNDDKTCSNTLEHNLAMSNSSSSLCAPGPSSSRTLSTASSSSSPRGTGQSQLWSTGS